MSFGSCEAERLTVGVMTVLPMSYEPVHQPQKGLCRTNVALEMLPPADQEELSMLAQAEGSALSFSPQVEGHKFRSCTGSAGFPGVGDPASF